MRFFFFLLALTGSMCGIGYPWLAANLSNAEIGVRPVYNRATGFAKVHMPLSPPQSPFRIFVRMTQAGRLAPGYSTSAVRIYGSSEKSIEFISDVTFSAAGGVTPQINGNVYEAFAGVLPVGQAGDFTFVLRKEGPEGIPMDRLDLIVRGRPIEVDTRIQYSGLAVVVIGLAGVIFWKRLRKLKAAAPIRARFGNGPAYVSRTLGYFSVLLIGAWAIVGSGYRWHEGSLWGQEIGRYLIFDRPSGFRPISLNLVPGQSPITFRFELTPLGNYQKPNSRTNLAVHVALYENTVRQLELSFSNVGEKSHWGADPVGKIFIASLGGFQVPQAGTYTIDAKRSGPEILSMRRIYVVLESGPKKRDPTMQRVANGILLSGLLAALMSNLATAVSKRRKPDRVDLAEPEKPKWGRDAADE